MYNKGYSEVGEKEIFFKCPSTKKKKEKYLYVLSVEYLLPKSTLIL